MNYKITFILFFLMAILGFNQASAQFTIADQNSTTSIVYDIEHSALDSITAHDIEAVTGRQPEVYTSLDEVEGNVIILGDISSDLINLHIDTTHFSGQWETYGRIFKSNPAEGINQAMFIAGSDPRGMAYGVFDFSKNIGALEKIISDQRGLLSQYINDDVSEVPQSFTPYKEVVEIYENGLNIREDITIIWPDDNHGYIRRFSNQAEQERPGGAGV